MSICTPYVLIIFLDKTMVLLSTLNHGYFFMSDWLGYITPQMKDMLLNSCKLRHEWKTVDLPWLLRHIRCFM